MCESQFPLFHSQEVEMFLEVGLYLLQVIFNYFILYLCLILLIIVRTLKGNSVLLSGHDTTSALMGSWHKDKPAKIPAQREWIISSPHSLMRRYW